MITADYIYDDTQLGTYLERAETFKNKMNDVRNSIDNLYKKIEADDAKWLGNGKETCAAFLALVDKYASLVAGNPQDVERIITDSALDNKNAEGTDRKHIDDLMEAIIVLRPEIAKFSKNAVDKAECIIDLDTVVKS